VTAETSPKTPPNARGDSDCFGNTEPHCRVECNEPRAEAAAGAKGLRLYQERERRV